MLIDVLQEIYERDLTKLKDEIAQFDEAALWVKPGSVPNSAGNLCLHLTGNLKHFFGAVLGGTGYIRDRDAEFSTTGVSRDELLADIDNTIHIVKETLAKLGEDELTAPYSIEVFGRPMTTAFFTTHLAAHLNWHLGQINYLRRFGQS